MPEDNSNDEPYIEDGENYYGGGNEKDIGPRGIILNQFNACLREGSKEMRSAGVETKQSHGREVLVRIPNQIEIFSNCVLMLQTALMPYTKGRKNICEDLIKNNKELNALEEEYKNTAQRIETEARRTGKTPMFDELRASFDIKTLPIIRGKLATLSQLLNELNYLGEAGMTV